MQVLSLNTVQDFFCFLKEKPSLISLILSTKSEKNTNVVLYSGLR